MISEEESGDPGTLKCAGVRDLFEHAGRRNCRWRHGWLGSDGPNVVCSVGTAVTNGRIRHGDGEERWVAFGRLFGVDWGAGERCCGQENGGIIRHGAFVHFCGLWTIQLTNGSS